MDFNNTNLGGFVLANDFYSLEPEIQSQYEAHIVFDISTDEIIVNNHSFGFSKKAKQEIEHDELVITQEFLELDISLKETNMRLNNLITTVENNITSSDTKIEDLSTLVFNSILDLSTEINKSEYVLLQELTVIDSSITNTINNFNSLIDDVSNRLLDVSNNTDNNFDELESVLIHYLEYADTSINMLETTLDNYTNTLATVNASILNIIQRLEVLENS